MIGALTLLVLAGGCRELDPLNEAGPVVWERVGADLRVENLAGLGDGRLVGLAERSGRRLLIVSEDRGRTWSTPWTPQPPFEDLAPVLAAAGDGAFYLAAATPLNPATGVRTFAVFRLTDGGGAVRQIGRTWTASALTALGADGDRLYVGTLGDGEHGLYRSADEGRTWSNTAVRTNRGGGVVGGAFATARTARVAAQLVEGSVLSDVYLSGDGGRTWRFAPRPPAPVTRIAFSDDGGLYAALDNPGGDGVYRYEGGRWDRLPLVVPAQRLHDVVALRGGRLFAAAGIDGVFLAPDRGAGWTLANEGLPTVGEVLDANIVDLLLAPDDHLYAVSSTALYRTAEPVR